MNRLAPTLVLLLAATAQTPTYAEVKAVTLTSSGLSEIIEDRQESSSVQLTFRQDQVSDVLKSLTLIGNDAAHARLRLESTSALDSLSGTLPFDPRRVGDLEYLLASLPGTEVRVAMWDEIFEGKVLGLSPDCIAPENCEMLMTLRSADGALQRIPLASDLKITFLNPAVQEYLARSLEAASRDASGQMRRLTLDIKAESGSEAPALFSYVIPAPAWKTSWRAEMKNDGTVNLQAWAVVENASGRDWDDIRLTLTTGSPLSLRTELYASDWKERDTLELDRMPAAPTPFLPEMQMKKERMALEAVPMMDMSNVDAHVATEERQAEARFTFAAPVSLKSGEILSMPFLGHSVSAKRVSRHVGGRFGDIANPDLSLVIENTGDVRLPGGIVTLQDEGLGYVGDAELPDIQPGETRSIPIGSDQKVSVSESVDVRTGEIHLRLEHGLLTVEETNLRETTYRLNAPQREGRLVLVDHPVLDGGLIESSEGGPSGEEVLENGQRFLRHEMDIKAGESATLRILEREPVSTTWAVTDLGEEQIEYWSGAEMSEDDRDLLDRLSEQRQKIAELEMTREALLAERENLVRDQERALGLMNALTEEDDARGRFREAVLQSEDRISEIDAKLRRLAENIAQQGAATHGHAQDAE